jgi:hypothetical protein
MYVFLLLTVLMLILLHASCICTFPSQARVPDLVTSNHNATQRVLSHRLSQLARVNSQ